MRDHDHIRQFMRPYVKPEDIPKLTSEEIQLMRLNTGLLQAGKEAAKKRRLTPQQRLLTQ